MSRLASRLASGLVALAVLLSLVAAPPMASAKQAAAANQRVILFQDNARRKQAHWRRYGFLPGYRPPEVIERQRREAYWASGPHFYGPAWPGFFRNRWNGGGFGPCYTYTPIGYIWNCGK